VPTIPQRQRVEAGREVDGWQRCYRGGPQTNERPFPRGLGEAVQRTDRLYKRGAAVRSRYFLNDGTECEISGKPFPARPPEASPDTELTWCPGLEAWCSELSDGTGVERYWSREGKLLKTSECVEGRRHGKTIFFRDDGLRNAHHAFNHPGFAVAAVVRVEGHFTEGNPVGWDFFDAQELRVDVAAALVSQRGAKKRAKELPLRG
jgi:hypothetical protein